MTDGSIHHIGGVSSTAASPSNGTLSASSGAPAQPPRVWAFASGKGGVGKSLITANLGALFAESDWPTLLIDLDRSGPNLHTFLGVTPEGPGVGDVLRGSLPMAQGPRPHRIPGLSYLLGGGDDWGDVPSSSGFLASLRRFQGDGDSGVSRPQEILLDCSSGAEALTLGAFLGADVPVLVITPDPASVENAHRFLDRAWCHALRAGLGGTLSPEAQIRKGLRGLGSGYSPRRLLGWLAERGGTFAPVGDPWDRGLRVGDTPRGVDGKGPAPLSEESLGDIWPVVPHLVVNRVNHSADVDVGFAMIRAVEDYFGIKMPYLGAIPEDPGVALSLQRRRVRVREPGEELLSKGLGILADHAVEGGGLIPGGDRLFAVS